MNHDELKKQICIQLGLNPDRPPAYLAIEQVSEVITIKVGTLAHWRVTGRSRLPFVKVGAKVVYPFDGLIEYMLKRTRVHTGGGGK